ncbi:hypothetical protein AB0N14_28110 [Streptomyces sp. NPDC051104]|uniref:hypothetical protein n=1 Tax=Streptomyces sp. NPDC051104 TaxID=3155044 RepID=UPI00341CB9CC
MPAGRPVLSTAAEGPAAERRSRAHVRRRADDCGPGTCRDRDVSRRDLSRPGIRPDPGPVETCRPEAALG